MKRFFIKISSNHDGDELTFGNLKLHLHFLAFLKTELV